MALLSVVLAACGGHSGKSGHGGSAQGMPEAGMGPIDDGSAGSEPGAAGGGFSGSGGSGGATQGGAGAAQGGAGGTAIAGGRGGAVNAGGVSAAGVAGTAGGVNGGGVASGGAPSGGQSALGGAGSGPTIDPPANCQSTSQSADATTCNYVYSCGGPTHFDDCSLDDTGVWSCECGTFSTDTRYFEVEGVKGALDACGTVARLCEGGDLSMSATRTCRSVERTNDGYVCSAHDTCGNAVDFDLPDGVVVRAVQHYRANCKPARTVFMIDEPFSCSCQGAEAGGYGTLTSAPSIDEVCEPIMRFCENGEDAPYTDRVCGYTASSGIVEQACPGNPSCQGCSVAQECATAAPIGNDVELIDEGSTTTHTIDCVPKQGNLRCVCDATDALYSDNTVPQSVLDVCDASLDVCKP